MTSTCEVEDDTTTSATAAATRPRRDGNDVALTIPRELWSPPISEATWCGVRPRLSKLLLLAPTLALVGAYVSASAGARGHLTASGWLLGLAVCSILAGATGLVVHARRLVRFHAEAPREDRRGDRDTNVGDIHGEDR